MTRTKDTKTHIGIYGRRNSGKSSLINALAGQDIAIVSDHAGTTTDPVRKSVELLDFGPVILVDTAGIDDSGELGKKRVERTLRTLDTVDLAIIVVNGNIWGDFEEGIVTDLRDREIPFIIVHSKSDIESLTEDFRQKITGITGSPPLEFSSADRRNFDKLISTITGTIPEQSWKNPTMLGDLIRNGDVVLLITPIDTEAPAGRMILPQVQAIRDILDNNAVAIVLKETEVEGFLKKTCIRPALAITDSQIFPRADALIPDDIPLTSFSIMLARFKGDFENYLKGTPAISGLRNGDRILILESCTHHVSCDDIGRVKIPGWFRKNTGKDLEFDTVAGLDVLPRPITEYALLIQCGGCMITRRQLHGRLNPAIKAGIPITNYGMAIAYLNGIYERAISPFLK